MASTATITVRVKSARGSSRVEYTSKGRYVSFTTAGYQRDLLGQPIQPTASLSAFWLSVLDLVVKDITDNP